MNNESDSSTSVLEPSGIGRLEEAAARFASVSDDLLAIWGFDGRIKWANPAHERVTGFSPQELAGRPYIDFVHPEDQERTIAEAARMTTTGARSSSYEARTRCRDGSYRWFLITATPSASEDLIYTIAKDVTQRRALEDEATRVMDLSLELLCAVDFEGRWRRVNPALEHALGQRADELLGNPCIEWVHPEDRASVRAEAERLRPSGTPTRDFRVRVRHKDGSYRAVLWSAASSPDERLIFAVGRDEREREASEEVLREAEERFEGVFDQAPIGMALISIDQAGAGVFLRVNDVLCDITGYPGDQLVGSSVHDLAHPDDYDPDVHYVPWMVAGEIPQYEVEKRLRHADGHYIWAQLTTSLVRDGNGRPLYLISQVQDITERKRSEHALIESRERLQAIIDNTPAIVVMKDSGGRYRLVNRRFEMLHGFTRDDVLGKTALDIFSPDVANVLEAEDEQVLTSGLAVEVEETVESEDGPRTFIKTKFPLLDPAHTMPTPYAVCAISTDITERKQAEQALRASEEHFRQIVATARDAFVAMEPSGVITAWNPQAERTFGWSEAEALGRVAAETITPPRYREQLSRDLEQFLQTGRGQLFDRRFETEALHRDGHEFPIEMTITPLRLDGRYVFNVFLHDISDRREAEEQIRRLASIVESSGDAIIGTTLDGVITTWNRGAERQFGYPAAEAIGQPIGIVEMTPYDEADVEVLATAAGREVSQLEGTCRRSDGATVDVSLTVSPIRDAMGAITGSAYIARDITERRRAERALRQMQEGFRTAFEDSPVGVALVSVEPGESGRLLQLNRSLCHITGYSTAELLEMTLAEVTHPDDVDAEAPLQEELLAGEIPNYGLEKRYVRKDGSLVWVMHNASTVHDASGNLLYGIAQVSDISERKRAEEELSAAHRELEQRAEELELSNSDLQQFAYAASHDLSEPLRMVSSYVQLLSRRYSGKLDSDADEFINFAVDGVVRMQALIEGLLMYSRAGTSEYEIAPVDCNEVAQATLVMMQTTIEERQAEVTIEPLPTVPADPSQLSQLFQNLIGNAIKFVPEGTPQVRVSADQVGDEWQFSVADNGIGIDSAHVGKIFAVFQRLHGRGEYAGSGIGLAICKRIAERHGGRIWVESEPGAGSTFRFTIPVERQEADIPDIPLTGEESEAR